MSMKTDDIQALQNIFWFILDSLEACGEMP